MVDVIVPRQAGHLFVRLAARSMHDWQYTWPHVWMQMFDSPSRHMPHKGDFFSKAVSRNSLMRAMSFSLLITNVEFSSLAA